MTKNINKYLIAILIVLLILTLIIPSISYGKDDLNLGDLNAYKNETEMSSLKTKAEGIIGIIRTIGVVASVVALMGIGIKYMMASLEERAQYKETMKPYIIGAFLVFSLSLIPQIIYDIMKNFE